MSPPRLLGAHYSGNPSHYSHYSFLVLGKLYSNALMAALNSRTHINAGTSQANMSVNSSINTRNHLTLFEDEYSNTDSTGKSTRVAVGRSVNVRHDPSHEMVVVSVSAEHLFSD